MSDKSNTNNSKVKVIGREKIGGYKINIMGKEALLTPATLPRGARSEAETGSKQPLPTPATLPREVRSEAEPGSKQPLPTAESGRKEPEICDGKPVIRYFVSYARKEKNLKDRLLDHLTERLDIAKEYYFYPWDDAEILAGDRWHEKIQAAVASCQFGLLLVSPAFLGSKYIKNHELPAFVASDLATQEPKKRAIPVALKHIPFDDDVDLKGLEKMQVFRDSHERAFQECRDEKNREDFAWELFQQILKIVKRYGRP